MALSNNMLAVGEVSSRPNQKEEDFSSNPRVFLFARTAQGWKAQGAIQRDVKNTPWWFGISIAMDGDTLAVGNPNALLPFTTDKLRPSLEPAMVCVYRKTAAGWKLEQEIANTGLSLWKGFGVNIALQGDLLAVRSVNPSNREDEIDVSVLRRVNGQWVSEGTLNPGEGATKGKGYGFALAIDQGRICVGDALAVEGSDSNGRVFVFEHSAKGWQEKWRLAPKVLCRQIHLAPRLPCNGHGWLWVEFAVSDLELSLVARCFLNWTQTHQHRPRLSLIKRNKYYFHQRTLNAMNNAPADNENGRSQSLGHCVGASGFSRTISATNMPHQIGL